MKKKPTCNVWTLKKTNKTVAWDCIWTILASGGCEFVKQLLEKRVSKWFQKKNNVETSTAIIDSSFVAETVRCMNIYESS